jgi:hypothetical protein
MKRLFLLLLTGFFLRAANAQIQLGVKGGVDFSTITGQYYGQAQTLAGFNVGALISLPLFNKFTLQPEIVYSSEGAKTTEVNVTTNLVNNYLNFPVLIKYNNATGIFVETGPQVGYLLNAKLKIPNFNEDEKPNDKNLDFSWVFGLGYLFKDLNLGIDARYNLGLSNFIDQNYIGNATNNVIEVGVFFVFGIKAEGGK